jgi:gluconolactonase
MGISIRFVALATLAALSACGSSAGTPQNPSGGALPVIGSIERLDPAVDALVPADAQMELLADGFTWVEGPVWRKSGGYLLFTDIPMNTIHSWSEAEGVGVFLRPAGYTRNDPAGWELGSNGLIFDSEDRLIMADHGNRQVARLDESNFTKSTLAERYQGRRLNSPNDLAFHSNGDLYFTDPPYGLDGTFDDPRRELDFCGVYRLTPSGELTLLTTEIARPNGIALSPDEQTLYVAASDPDEPVWRAFDLLDDGTITNGRIIFDASAQVAAGLPGVPDGMTVDVAGNIFATGPGGVFILAPDGRHLGTLLTGDRTSNVEFGDDGSTLYITSNSRLLRIRLNTKGLGF